MSTADLWKLCHEPEILVCKTCGRLWYKDSHHRVRCPFDKTKLIPKGQYADPAT